MCFCIWSDLLWPRICHLSKGSDTILIPLFSLCLSFALTGQLLGQKQKKAHDYILRLLCVNLGGQTLRFCWGKSTAHHGHTPSWINDTQAETWCPPTIEANGRCIAIMQSTGKQWRLLPQNPQCLMCVSK